MKPARIRPGMILLLYLLVHPGLAWSQPARDKVADSLRTLAVSATQHDKASDYWLELSKHYRKSNLDSSEKVLERAISFAELSGDTERQTRCIMSHGALKYMQGDYKTAEQNYLKAIDYWKQKGNEVEIARCMNNLGNVCQRANQYPKAIKYLKGALAIAKNKKEFLIQAQAAGTLCTVFFDMGQPDSVGKYNSIAKQGFISLNDSANLARVNVNLGYFYRELGMLAEAKRPTEEALTYLPGVKETGLIGEVHNANGLLNYKTGNFNDAVHHFVIAGDCFRKLKWHLKSAETDNYIGNCFKTLGRYSQAQKHYQAAWFLADSIANHAVASASLAYVAEVKGLQGDYKSAVDYYKRAELCDRHSEGNPAGYAIQLGLSRSWFELGEMDSASFHLAKAMADAEERNKPERISECRLQQARILIKNAGYLPALNEIEKSRRFYLGKKDAEGIWKSYALESECLEAMGKIKEALAAERNASRWKDSVQQVSAYDQLLSLEAKYWSERKQHELDMALQTKNLSQKEAERAAAEAAKFSAQRNLLLTLIALGLLLAAGGIWFSRKQRKMEMERKLAELKMVALRAQMNPHFIFNALGSVQLLINTNAVREANLYLSKFAQLLRLTLERSGDSESTLQDEIVALRLYVELEALRFKFQYEFTVDPQIHPEGLLYPTLLLQPIVENAIKHGFGANRKEARIAVRFSIRENEILCEIIDNGMGRKASRKPDPELPEARRSFGLQITRERLGLLQPVRNDRMTIIDLFHPNGDPAGTQVNILVPVRTL